MADVDSLAEEVASLRATVEKLQSRVETLEKGGSSASSSRYGGHARRTSGRNGSAARTPTSDRKSARRRPGSSTKSRNSGRLLSARTKNTARSDAGSIAGVKRSKYQLGNRKINVFYPDNVDPDAKGQNAAAETDLTLSFVYGYNGKDTRRNLFFADDDGTLVYSVAATGVVYDTKNGQQRFFIGHNEDIMCLAKHPSRPIVATGQLDPKGAGTPYVCVWDYNTMEKLAHITYHDRAVSSVQFSPDGKYLATIGDDDSHTLAFWAWEGKQTVHDGMNKPIVTAMTSKSPVFGISFNPFADSDEYEFYTSGVKTFKSWKTVNLGGADEKKRSLSSSAPSTFGVTKIVAKNLYSPTYVNASLRVLGTSEGYIYAFDADNKLVKFFQPEGKKPVQAIVRIDDESYAVATSGGSLITFNDQHEEQSKISFADLRAGAPRSLDLRDGKFVIGTKNNTIVVIDGGAASVLTSGHNDEVWGLAVHPTEPVLVSSANDGTVRFWNYNDHAPVADTQLDLKKNKVRSAAFSPDGGLLAIGTWAGTVLVYDYKELYHSTDPVIEAKVSKETVDFVEFSPDGKLLAAASWDQFIHIIDIDAKKPVRKCKGHTASVLMVNFSSDGKYLQSNSRDYEILYWDVATGKRINVTEELINTEWQNWNCFLGWPVQGIWAGANDGTDINMVARSHNQKVLAAGDDFGHVRLFSYPVIGKHAQMKQFPGHSSHVSNVRFSPDDAYVFSAGGADCGVFQWENA